MIDITKLIELKQWVIDHTDTKVYIIENVYVTKLSTNGDLVIIIESDITEHADILVVFVKALEYILILIPF